MKKSFVTHLGFSMGTGISAKLSLMQSDTFQHTLTPIECVKRHMK